MQTPMGKIFAIVVGALLIISLILSLVSDIQLFNLLT